MPNSEDLLPVRRRVVVPAAGAAAAVRQLAGIHPIVRVEEDPTRPYTPGDPTVSAWVTTLEPPPAAPPPARGPRPWHLYLLGGAALVFATALLVAVLTDPYLVAGVAIFVTLLGAANAYDRVRDRRR